MSEDNQLNLLTEEELAALEQSAHGAQTGILDTDMLDATVNHDAGDSTVLKTPRKAKQKLVLSL